MTHDAQPAPIGRRRILAGAAAATTALGLGSATAAQAHGPSLSGQREPGPRPLSSEGRELVSAGPGRKWDVDGHAQRFRGNTFVYPVPQDSAFFAAQNEAQELIAASRYANHFALLPHNSMHMTLFDGTNDADRLVGVWPEGVDPSADLTVATQHMLGQLQGADLQVPETVSMSVTGMKSLIDAGAPQITLTGADEATQGALRTLRRQLSDLTGMRGETPDTYEFHSTLAYRLVAARRSEHRDLQRLQDEILGLFVGDAATVTLEPVAFTPFDDMIAFPQLHLL